MSTMRRIVSALALVSLLGACASPMMGYEKDGIDQSTFQKERFDCIKDARKEVALADRWNAERNMVTDTAIFTNCMAVKGYSLNRDGKG